MRNICDFWFSVAYCQARKLNFPKHNSFRKRTLPNFDFFKFPTRNEISPQLKETKRLAFLLVIEGSDKDESSLPPNYKEIVIDALSWRSNWLFMTTIRLWMTICASQIDWKCLINGRSNSKSPSENTVQLRICYLNWFNQLELALVAKNCIFLIISCIQLSGGKLMGVFCKLNGYSWVSILPENFTLLKDYIFSPLCRLTLPLE